MTGLLATLMIIVSIFLILLILVQRGRGGGLAGALGGMGGQSAFGTKAGDLFTRVTIGVAAVWIFLCLISLKLIGTSDSQLASDLGGSAPTTIQETVPPGSQGQGQAPTGQSATPDTTAPSGGAGAPGATDQGAGQSQPTPTTDESKSSK